MLDETLRLGAVGGSRPTTVPGLPGFQPYPFPDFLAPDYWNLFEVIDVARVRPIYANFEIVQAFNGPVGVANNVLRFAIWAATAPTVAAILADGAPQIGRSLDFTGIAGLATETEKGVLSRTQGFMVQVPLPPLADLSRVVSEGRQYVMAGFEANIPTVDYNAGLAKCYLTDRPLPSKPMNYRAGY